MPPTAPFAVSPHNSRSGKVQMGPSLRIRTYNRCLHPLDSTPPLRLTILSLK